MSFERARGGERGELMRRVREQSVPRERVKRSGVISYYILTVRI